MANINLFSQIISKLERLSFSKLVKEKETDKHQKGFNSWTHLVSMLFCQFAKSRFDQVGRVLLADAGLNPGECFGACR